MKNSSPFAYLRKRNAKAVSKKLGASNGSGSQMSNFLHLNTPQRGAAAAEATHSDPSPGQRLFAAHQKRVAAKDYSVPPQPAHAVTPPLPATKGRLTPGQSLVSAYQRQVAAKESVNHPHAADASPSERMLGWAERRPA
ncbi:hypothetical protein GOB87_09810 [Acetobacter estunensis]|uniref:Uncharacterized protein n=1 Tax=Acetobacter estunensis TaxID=104097 RepID=A0A967EHU3_9PROT|nr:hypothetical protein [Acetobacter estunensis]NHO54247.1 hypothetical protein [Acetobacter estunensis]